MDTKKIIKYVSNNMDAVEKQTFESEMRINDTLCEEVKNFQSLWNLSEFSANSIEELDDNWEIFQEKKEGQLKYNHKKGASVWPKVAASIMLLVATAFFIWFFSSKNYGVKSLSEGHHQLVDNSNIELNSNSLLTVDKNFSISNRNVKLEGEAFFDVAKNSNHPLIVKINNAEIIVLGTKFNVLSTDNFSAVELYEGSIELKTSKKIIKIKPNERWEWIDGKWVLSENTSNGPSWIDSESWNFQNASLQYIVNQIERHYNIEPLTYNFEKQGERYTIVLPKNNIEKALHLLSKISNIPFDK
jgi:ferric-dicitrate binding protein FerR (iron transport regulator)